MIRYIVPILLVLFVCASSPPLQADSVPSAITYQGRLTNGAGQPVADGSRAMQFKLYNAESGGTLLWDSGTLNVVTLGGNYTTVLGSPSPAITSSTLSSADVWMEVKVGTDPALPRVKLQSTPFALRAGDLAMPFSKTVSSSPSFTPAFEVKNTTANYAIRGEANNASFAGVMGDNTGSGFGVYGHSQSGTAVRGYQQDSGNLGVLGGPSYGVLGSSSLGYGLWGNSSSGFAGYFEGDISVMPSGGPDPGRVGIGLTTPNRKLYVVDQSGAYAWPLKLDNPNSYVDGTGTGIMFSVGGDGGHNLSVDRGKGVLAYWLTDTWNRGDFHFLQDSGANANQPDIADSVLTIKNSGRVGIGTTTPGARLEVAGAIRVQGSSWPSSGEGLEIGYSPTLNKGYIQSYDRTGGTWGKLYLGDGNVGIGKSDPTSKLDVVGNAAVSGTATVTDMVVTGQMRGTLGPNFGGAFPKPAYDSGFFFIDPGVDQVLDHNIGLHRNRLIVDLEMYNNTFGIVGVNNFFIGTDWYFTGNYNQGNPIHGTQGFYWSNLTETQITIHREPSDDPYVGTNCRIRIWVGP